MSPTELASHFTPFYLLSNLRVMTGRQFERQPNWVLASNLFAVGSATACQLCLEAGIAPDGLDMRKVACLPSRVSVEIREAM